MRIFILSFMVALSVAIAPSVSADTIDLRLGLVRAGGQNYFVDLLRHALEADGHKVNISVEGELPQKRMVKMMTDGELSLTWLLQSEERDKKFIPIKIPITDGLIGHRILLIPSDQQARYDEVQTLADFRALDLVGVFGQNWFDVDIWKHNQLKFIEKDGRWQEKVYKQIASGNRGVDYFSRGFFEVIEEHKKHPFLAIENNLILIYDRDFRYYLSESEQHLKEVIEKALINAQKSGLMTRLIRQHWGESFEILKPEARRKIRLETPPG